MFRRLLPAAALLACISGALGAAAPASQAAQRLESFELPSLRGNVDPAKVKLNRGMTSLRASVLLPDGYDQHPNRAYPVLYLLHGGADNSETWAREIKGDVTNGAKGFPGIIVMPEAGTGSFVDWWMGGARNGPRWTRYYLDEVFPTIEAKYRILPGRTNHAIAGLSMGAYGALFLGGQLPSYFGTIVSMSAVLDTQTLSNWVASKPGSGVSFETMMGPITGDYAIAHNPMRTIANVAKSRIYLMAGNGVADPRVPGDDENAKTIGAVLEFRLMLGMYQYALMAPLVGARPVIRQRGGVHNWPWWKLELPRVLEWGVFGKPPVASSGEARKWRYRTMEPAGNAWGLGYRFAAPTTRVVTFERDGQRLTGKGAGRVTISPGAADGDATGAGTRPDCSFTAELPFDHTLPAGC